MPLTSTWIGPVLGNSFPIIRADSRCSFIPSMPERRHLNSLIAQPPRSHLFRFSLFEKRALSFCIEINLSSDLDSRRASPGGWREISRWFKPFEGWVRRCRGKTDPELGRFNYSQSAFYIVSVCEWKVGLHRLGNSTGGPIIFRCFLLRGILPDGSKNNPLASFGSL